MNYILKLQEENEELKCRLKEALHYTEHLWEYAHSSKFMGEIEDEYINKRDIFLRVEPILKELRYD